MRAAVYTAYGPPEVVRVADVPTPSPADNEVLVRVRATTVCAADWRLRSANPFVIRFINGLRKPKLRVLGMEFSGTIETAGKSVTRFAPGDPVFGMAGFRFGAHAQYVCVPDDRNIAAKPANMTFEEAAAVLFGACTSLHFLRLAGVRPGQHVLVYGASGSCGVFAVQLAKHFGARVTGVCSGANVELVKSLGADHVVDYTREDFSKAGRIYDIIVDTVGYAGFSRSMRCLKRSGAYAQIGGRVSAMPGVMLGGLWKRLTGAAKVVTGVTRVQDGDLAFLKELIEAGKLRTVIERRYTLDQIVDAHRHAEGGHKKGHVVIVVE